MTLQEISVIRQRYYDAIMALDLSLMDHEIGDARYDNDAHRDSLQKAFLYWDTLYNRKSGAGTQLRLGMKVV